mmetsp:Transcript_14754/g.50318  ORF Transcript_14754/g.50318 Transcript_14754/m.50318 type:complete len:227 (-) Transcript_14754:652-1332(-)
MIGLSKKLLRERTRLGRDFTEKLSDPEIAALLIPPRRVRDHSFLREGLTVGGSRAAGLLIMSRPQELGAMLRFEVLPLREFVLPHLQLHEDFLLVPILAGVEDGEISLVRHVVLFLLVPHGLYDLHRRLHLHSVRPAVHNPGRELEHVCRQDRLHEEEVVHSNGDHVGVPSEVPGAHYSGSFHPLHEVSTEDGPEAVEAPREKVLPQAHHGVFDVHVLDTLHLLEL